MCFDVFALLVLLIFSGNRGGNGNRNQKRNSGSMNMLLIIGFIFVAFGNIVIHVVFYVAVCVANCVNQFC